MKYLFRMNGEYVGFLSDGWFFAANGCYLGWCEGGDQLWRSDGNWLGCIREQYYVLRRRGAPQPVPQPPRVPPVPPSPPLSPGNLLPRAVPPGWLDALEAVAQLPAPDRLVGRWRDGADCLELRRAGTFAWTAASGERTRGSWSVSDATLIIDAEGAPSGQRMRYAIVDLSAHTLRLVGLARGMRNLPILLTRERGAATA